MVELIDREVLIKHIRQYKTVYGTPMTKRDEQVVHYIIGHIKNLELTTTEAEIRAKAKQELAKAIILELECFAKEQDGEPNVGFIDMCIDTVREIAEQLKRE